MAQEWSASKKLNNYGPPIEVTERGGIGSPTERAAITVTAVAQAITISALQYTIELFNADAANDIYYGGSTVDSTRGVPLYAGTGKIFNNVTDTFTIYVVCAAGLTANLRVVEYA